MILPKRKQPAIKKKSLVYPTTPCNSASKALMRRIQKERDKQAAEWGKLQPVPLNSSDTP